MAEPRPDSPHAEYAAHSSQWKRARDTFAGTDAVKGAREEYLPKLDVHLRGTKGDERYNAYLRRAYFYNAVKRTVVGLSGLIHQTEPSVEAPDALEGPLSDVTITGVSAKLLSLLTTQEVLLVGRAGILVEMSEGPDARPYWVPFKAENIVNWRVGYDGGEPYLALVVLKVCGYEADPADRFASKEVEKYRMLALVDGAYVQTVWTLDAKTGKWDVSAPVIARRRGEALDFIPFVFVGPTSSDPTVEAPPLIDLIDLNISHYQTTANLEHGLGYLGAPSLVLIGAVDRQGKPIEYGSSSAILLPTGGDAKILQADGNMMGALERSEERKRKLLATLGARLLEEQPAAAETAAAVGMRHSGEHATLRTVAQSVERAFTDALQVTVWWYGTDADPESVDANFELNKDFFNMTLGAEDVKTLILALQADAISFETFWKEFTDGGHGRPGVSADQELAEIRTQAGPKPVALPNPSKPPCWRG